MKINNECSGCMSCVNICPADAIQGKPESYGYEIDIDKCVECHACIEVCEYKAIEK